MAIPDKPSIMLPLLELAAGDPDTSAGQLPKSAFEFIQPCDTAGNLGHNVFRKDGIFNINLAGSKERALLARLTFDLGSRA